MLDRAANPGGLGLSLPPLNRLEALAKRARARHLGLWGAWPNTRYDPYHGIETDR